jgi:cytochrome c oxidase subunit I+III
MVSTMIPTLARTRLVGQRAIVGALISTAAISFPLWAHHMFTAGLGSFATTLVSVASLAVAVPTAIQVFAWMATLASGRLQWCTPTLFLIGFFVTFVMGGLTGVMVAVAPFDWQVHDSYFIVAHLHYVLIGGVLFPIIAAMYYWWPLLRGHRLSERWGRWIFALVFGGFHLTFFPMHIAGIIGMPRRIYTYEAGLGWDGLNLLSSIGSAVLGIGMAALLIDVWRSSRLPPREHDDPWHAPTLEWLPSADYSTRSIPQITSAEPLWDQADLAGQVTRGQHWLPGTATGLRETIVTSPVQACLMHLIILPPWSWLPFIAALGTAGFFLLLTIKWVITAFACGVLAVASTLAWLWETDRLPSQEKARIGTQVEIPIGSHGMRSHSWWATVILLVVDFSVLASMVFAHIHVTMKSDVCPPAGVRLPDAQGLLWPSAALLAGMALVWMAGQGRHRHTLGPWRCAPLMLAAGLLIAAFMGTWGSFDAAGLAAKVRAWDATVAALLAYMGFHAVLMLICTLYLCARIACGLSQPRQRATFDNVQLLWAGSCVQGVVTAWLPGLLVRALV